MVQKLFLAAADLPAAEQSRFLNRHCGADPELRAEIEEMLAADRDGEDLIVSAVEREAAVLFDSPAPVGDRLGAYRLVREIGRGGMGVVYLATRDDEQFRKQAAIKVVKRGMDSDQVLVRFRHERQILANLDHPYIGRLLDAGTTSEGRPFLVMDYVEGRPIDVFCRESGLSLEAILQLFLKVASAVSHAHRNLIVHRDLKPANILVSADGTPKLLDFGVAKLLDPRADEGLTLTKLDRPLTPAYASPEQLRGLAVTTSADVYSLGVVLYELLTGRRPAEGTGDDLERRICETDPAAPSSWNCEIDADIDNIVLMALRREAERRYASVDALAQDIQRYLTGWPVAARPESVVYRARKFCRRQQFAISAAALVLVSLILGVIVSVSQARRAEAARGFAEQERRKAEIEHHRADQQRDSAIAERSRAEEEAQRARQRLVQIVELSNRSLAEAYAERVSGEMEAREEFMRGTVDLLATLSREAGSDRMLRSALAKAYLGFGKLEGDQQAPDRRSLARAIESFHEGEALLGPVDPAEANPDRTLLWLEMQQQIGKFNADRGDSRTAREILQRAFAVASELLRTHPGDANAIRSRARVCHWLSGSLELGGDTPRAIGYTELAVHSLGELARRFPGDDGIRYELSISETRYGWELITMSRLESALPHYQRVVWLREGLVKNDPRNVLYRRGLKLAYEHVAALLGGPLTANLGRIEEARPYFHKARELEENVKSDQAYFLLRSAIMDTPADQPAESLARLRESAALYEAFAAADPRLISYCRELASARTYMGHKLLQLERPAEAETEYTAALRQVERVLASVANDQFALAQAIDAEAGIARARAAVRDEAGALAGVAAVGQRIAAAMQVSTMGRADTRWLQTHIAQGRVEMASVYRTFGHQEEARKAARLALAGFEQLRGDSVKSYEMQARAILNESTVQ